MSNQLEPAINNLSYVDEYAKAGQADMMTNVSILTYHAIDRRNSAITVTPEDFAWQMRWLFDQGFCVIPLSCLVEHLQSGSHFPNRSIVLTFDDGFDSVYSEAFPILSQYRFPATVFLVTGHCGGYNDWSSQPRGFPHMPMLSWSHIREMGEHDIEFGAHSIMHPRLDRISHEEMVFEVIESKRMIEEQVGLEIKLFAYPYGQYDEGIKEIVSSAYRAACTTRLGLVNASSDPFELQRIDAYYTRHPFIFQWLSQPNMSIYLGFRRSLRRFAAAFLGRPWN